jgi:DNA primase
MSGRIPRQFIDDLLVRVDIVDLIDSRVPLKKVGSNFVARCPFHTEKTPSFSVNRNRQTYHCFGCGAGGNAISFLIDYAHLGFVEAVEDLAAFIGVDVPREAVDQVDFSSKQDTSRLYALLEQVAAFYVEQLRSHEGKVAIDYLKQRGLTGEIARDFGLGYAPNSWDALLARFDQQTLVDAGMLVVKEDGKVYDRFRGRLMFPIRDKRKRVIGFGGRVLDDSLPKYLNSPETDIFSKGKEVYGLCELLENKAKPERILIVEGYMDVIALAQYGVHNAVAALGTATSKVHMDLLFRFASELVFCFDGDNAGRQAAWKAVEAALPSLRDGRQIKIMLLPQGHDPDSMIREESLQGFESRIADALVLSDYFFEHLGEGLNLATVEGKAKLLSVARPQLEKMPRGFFREMMFARLREITGAKLQDAARGGSPIANQAKDKVQSASMMRKLLALLLQYPQLSQKAEQQMYELVDVNLAGMDLLKQVLELISREQPKTSAVLIEIFRGTEHEKVINALANLAWEVPEFDADAEFGGAWNQLLRQIQDNRMAALIEKSSRGESLTADELNIFKRGGKINL